MSVNMEELLDGGKKDDKEQAKLDIEKAMQAWLKKNPSEQHKEYLVSSSNQEKQIYEVAVKEEKEEEENEITGEEEEEDAVVDILTCRSCSNMEFKTKAELRIHMNKVHTNGYPLYCTICTIRFRYQSSYNTHMEFKHGVANKNPIVKYLTPDKETLDAVANGHDASGKSRSQVPNAPPVVHPLVCKLCDGMEFESKKELREHLASVHTGGSQYYCTLCSRRFKMRVNYEVHLHRDHHINVKDPNNPIANTAPQAFGMDTACVPRPQTSSTPSYSKVVRAPVQAETVPDQISPVRVSRRVEKRKVPVLHTGSSDMDMDNKKPRDP